MNEFSYECVRRLGYHPVSSEAQRLLFEENRRRFMELYTYLETTYGWSDAPTAPTRELRLAMDKLQEALMWTNAHLACNSVYATSSLESWLESRTEPIGVASLESPTDE